jgi:Peptidase C39 family
MSMNYVRRVMCARIMCFILAFGFTAKLNGASSSDTNYDCGTLALYSLLRLEGLRPDPRLIDAALPPRRSEGYTMMEMKTASASGGLPLSGVRLRKGEKLPDCGMIAFVKRNGHGHYVVARRVGHSGKLVQIIDPGNSIEVLDINDLWGNSDWSGLALIPDRSGRYRWMAGTASAVLFCLGLACRLSAGRRMVRKRNEGMA